VGKSFVAAFLLVRSTKQQLRVSFIAFVFFLSLSSSLLSSYCRSVLLCSALSPTVPLCAFTEQMRFVFFNFSIPHMCHRTGLHLCGWSGCWKRQCSESITDLSTTMHCCMPVTLRQLTLISILTRNGVNRMGVLFRTCWHSSTY
jgi:hypothetical protein